MSKKEQALRLIRQLREMGYAITIFSPQKMQGVDPRGVETAMVAAGNECVAGSSFGAHEEPFEIVPVSEKFRVLSATKGQEVDPHFSVPVDNRGQPEVGVFSHKSAERALCFHFQSHQDIHNFLAEPDNRAALLWMLAEVLPGQDAPRLIESHIKLSSAAEVERESGDWTMSEFAKKALHRAGAWLGK